MHIVLVLAMLLFIVCISGGVWLAGYGVSRLLHIPMRWLLWSIGGICIGASVLFCASVLQEDQYVALFGWLARESNVLGALAILITLYSCAQWLARKFYVSVKRWAMPLLVRWSRHIFLFFREHHQFLGWIVFATATAHACFFLPSLLQMPVQEIFYKSAMTSGFFAWGVLALLVLLGLIIDSATRQKRPVKNVRLVHILLALVFVGGIGIHLLLS